MSIEGEGERIVTLSVDSQFSVKVTNMSFVCALMVIVTHAWCSPEKGGVCWWVNMLTADGICRIAVPFFFLVSGYFLGRKVNEPNWYRNAIRRRAVTIAVPYVFWNAIAFVLWGILSWRCAGRFQLGVSDALMAGVRMVGLDFGDWPPLFPLWFLRVLMAWVLVSFVFQWAGKCKFRWTLLCLLVMSLGALQLWRKETGPGWVEYVGLDGAVYFPIGVFLSRMDVSLELSRMGGAFSLVLGVGALIGKVVFLLSDSSALILLMKWVALPLCLMGIWSFIPDTTANWLKRFVVLSFPIYMIHVFVIRFYEMLFNQLGVGPSLRSSTAGFLIRAILFCISSTLLADLLCRWRFAKMTFGGRGELKALN